MKQYRSIPKEIDRNVPIIAFDKIDGSNIRVEWDKKEGFNRFGSRKKLLNGSQDNLLNEAIALIHKHYGEKLTAIFQEQKYQQTTCYFEFYGANSAFGQHQEDEEHFVTLIDIEVYKKGFLLPSHFVRLFESVGIPKILYEGTVHQQFIESVKNKTLEGISLEGVVCKSDTLDKWRMPIYFKIKTTGWLEKLKTYCKGDEKLFELLS